MPAGWRVHWGLWDSPLCLSPRLHGAGTDQKGLEPLVRQVFCVFAAGTSLSQLVWNRCCVPLTSDPKIMWRVLWGPWDHSPSLHPRWPRAGTDGKLIYLSIILLIYSDISILSSPSTPPHPVILFPSPLPLWGCSSTYSLLPHCSCIPYSGHLVSIDLSTLSYLHKNWLYNWSQNSLQQIQEDWNNPMHPIRLLQTKAVFNSNKNNRKPTYTGKLNNTLLNDNLVKEETKKLKTLEFS